MEKTFFRTDMAKQLTELAAQTENSINGAVEKLREAGLKIDSTRDLKKICPRWLRETVGRGFAELTKNVGFMPQKLKQEYENYYKNVESECLPLCEQIQTQLARYKGVTLETDGGGCFHFKDKDIRAMVEAKATYSFSEQERAYFARMDAIREKIEDLATFERENSLNDFSCTIAPWLKTFDEGAFLNLILQGDCLRSVKH